MRLSLWLARTPQWGYTYRRPEPHEWYGLVIRLHRLVIWFVV